LPTRKRSNMGKTNQTGRSNKKDRYVALPHYIMNTFAWQRLSVTARAAWLEFVRVHNSFNNGKIAMSERTLAKRLGVVRNTASRAIKELLTFGFIEITKASTFNIKRRAAEYRLTHIKDDITGELPSRAFQNIGKAAPSGNGLASNEQQSTSHSSRQDTASKGANFEP
jgi:DNA-binding transcriptional regulator YhcF (GntR family)